MSKEKKSVGTVFVLFIVFLTVQLSQLVVTPFGEGMDELWHLGYVIFLADKGSPPLPEDISFPQQLLTISEVLPSPAYPDDDSYLQWAAVPPDDRGELKASLLSPIEDPQYVTSNYQSQHPPLYYYLLSVVYERLLKMPLDRVGLILRCTSIILAALAIPALYLTFRLYVSSAFAVLTTLIAVWYPNLMPFLGRITNDTLAFPLVAWSTYLALRPQKGLPSVLASSVLLVLGLFTKSYFLTIAPAIFLLCAIRKEPGHSVQIWWTGAICGALIIALGMGMLVSMNFINTGHLLLLSEVRSTVEYSTIDKITAIFRISPVWFLGGIAKGFFWSGYWSFVSPSNLYYLPLLFVVLLFVYKVHHDLREHNPLDVEILWSHYLMVCLFLAGMLWHAALFKLAAEHQGRTVHSGNEGWYLSVLVGSILSILLVWMNTTLSNARVKQFLRSVLIFVVAWNIIARISMIVFWSGAATVEGKYRTLSPAVDLADLYSSLDNWASLPGVFSPVVPFSLAPLLIAVVVTFGIAVYGIERMRPQLLPLDNT